MRRPVVNQVRRLVLVSVGLALMFSVLAGLAYAQDRSVVGEQFDVELTVQENGDVDVVETRTFTFKGGPFHYGFRTIPLTRLEGITNVEFYAGDRRYQQSGSEAPYTYQASVDGAEFQLRWYFPETSDSTHTFTLKYTARGATRIYEGGDQIWWTAVEADRSYPVRSSQVTVHLPEGVEEIQKWDAYGVSASADQLDSRTLVFSTQETVPPGQGFDVRVQFPHGVVEGSPPAWQKDFDAQVAEQQAEGPAGAVTEPEDPTRQIINLLLGFIGIFIAVVGIVGLFLLWYTRGRDAPVPLVAEYLPERPSELPPGVAGTLLDETADMQDIIATIVDLARRGVITMREIEEKGFLGIGARHDFVFEKQDHEASLRPYEKTLLQEFFGGRQSRKLSSLKEKFYKVIPDLREQLYAEVVREDFFQRSPDTTRRTYTVLGIVGIVFSVIFAFFSLIVMPSFAEAVICIPFGLGVVAVGILIFARVMPRKTTKGSEAAARWQAFKRYLDNIEDYADLEQAKGIFDKYLPYAIAFGLENAWVRKFSEVDAPAPPWYRPAGGPYWGGPWRRGRRGYRRGGRPVFTGSGEQGGEGAMPDMGESGGGMPDLQRTSDSLGRGLQSMSDGLATMLSSAGGVLSSTPRSSGGGSHGGWSGGGGGSFGGGGGGSGGGSSGFG
ncbi:MAG: hypothetical protein MAG451_01356 [Anaerolineales bacterium]|nr:hypothetical protein [Anaerolineales bacterium]